MTDQPTTEQHTDDAATPTGTPHADTTVNGAADQGVAVHRADSADHGAPAEPGSGPDDVSGAPADGAAPADAAVTDGPSTSAETDTETSAEADTVTSADTSADVPAPAADPAAVSSTDVETDAPADPAPDTAAVSSTDVETATAADPVETGAPGETGAPVDPAPVSSTDVETATTADPVETGAPADPAPVSSTDVETATDGSTAAPVTETSAVVETPAVVAAVASKPAVKRTPIDPALADTVPPPVRRASADPDKWGRVDADGTVHVRTADGERAVGSWQAGEPQEGLAHFARRFDDVLTEVELIAARLASGHGDPKQLSTSLRQHHDALTEAHVVGDLVGLQHLLEHLLAKADVAIGVARQARDVARQESTARKQALVEEAEKIAEEATQWKVAGDRLREILDEWKTIRGVDRKTDDVLWKRFGKARDAFNRRRGSHFAEMDRQRAAAKTRKEEIVAEAEQIATSGEWGPTAGRYKQLMTDWKAAGRAPKDADDVLWQRFRAAQDAFFSRRSSAFTERDSELTENATKKEALLAEAERLDPAKGGVDATRAALHRIQERWDAIGHVPRERMREFEQRLRQVEERVRGAADAQWRRSDPETEARVAQFRERVEQFEAQAKKARAAGDERRAKQADAQAAQWREWLAAAEQAAADR